MFRGIYSKKRGQIWVETVIYTLIAFVMIGLVLSFVKPEISKISDKTLLEQSMNVLDKIEDIISSIERVAGNKRELELGVKKGAFTIDGVNDQILFKMESEYMFSEPGYEIQYQNVKAFTKKIGEGYEVTLTKDYIGNYDLKYNGKDEIKEISKSSVSYKVFISNSGESGEKTIINFEVV